MSYRCPVDVMALLSCKYEGGAKSASTVTRSLFTKPYTSLGAVPLDNKKFKYLVFKQSEKDLMKKAGYDVSTIHEYQGKQAKHIIVVRTSTKTKEEIYLSPSHVLVAISRHTDSLTYYTPVTDLMRKTLDTRISNADIDKTKVSNKGGAIVDCVLNRPNEDSNCVFVNDMMLRALMSTEMILEINQRQEIYSPVLHFGTKKCSLYRCKLS